MTLFMTTILEKFEISFSNNPSVSYYTRKF